MNLAEFARWASQLTTVAEAILLIEMLCFGLTRKYVWLVVFFLGDILSVVFAIGATTYSLRYGYVYFGGQAAKSLFAVAVSIQLWLLALAAYPAVARFGRRVLIYLLLGAMLVAAAGLLLEPARSGVHSWNAFPHYFNAIEGAVDSMVAIFLIVATAFLLWFPLAIPRNVAVFIAGFVFYWVQHRGALLMLNLYPGSARGLSAANLIFQLACLIFWIALVRRRGEIVKTVTGHRWNPSEAARLLGQLNAINTRMQEMVE